MHVFLFLMLRSVSLVGGVLAKLHVSTLDISDWKAKPCVH